MTRQELVEKMAVHGYRAYRDGNEGWAFTDIARAMLSVVLDNIDDVVEIDFTDTMNKKKIFPVVVLKTEFRKA